MVTTSIWGGSQGFLVLRLFIIPLALQTCAAKHHHHYCAPSTCGKLPNISYPFRLREDPKMCGEREYVLDCVNNVAILHLNYAEYYVEAINYNNYTVRLVDPDIQEANCSSMPRYLLINSNFSSFFPFQGEEFYSNSEQVDPYQPAQARNYNGYFLTFHNLLQPIIYFKCADLVKENASYVDTTSCLDDSNTYAIVGDIDLANWRPGCSVKAVFLTSSSQTWCSIADGCSGRTNFSYEDIHRQLAFGFELSWMHFVCHSQCGSRPCYFNDTIGGIQCYVSSDTHCYYINGGAHSCGILARIGIYTKASLSGILIGLRWLITFRHIHLDNANAINRAIVVGYYGLPSFVAARFLFGATLLMAITIHKWRRRHLSVYENIENFLQNNELMPIRYSYKEMKKMTNNFKIKLGQGGFGSVYKGKLRSGPYVAIKMLGTTKTNGQDFISEVATIGRIHHVNVVRLIGYCVEGSKRALIYEFMPCGSLDKYVFLKEGGIALSYEKIYEISLAIAHGIAYLHQGCDMQILHFDIKPHNILLDENFTPKVSDFGLAKLYPVNNSIVTLTAARGTLGYMAPELFYKNIGGVSYKSDVYSFGMLLMEMASKRKNSNPNAEHSSQAYFPFWIHDQLSEDRDIEMEGATEEEKILAKKMLITALWCIQLKPHDRPSMREAIKMLEGKLESLEIPTRPSFYPDEPVDEEGIGISSRTSLTNGFSRDTTDLVPV